MKPTVNTLFYKRLATLKLQWHDVVHEKLRIEDEIARYEDAAVLVGHGKDPCYALLSIDCHYEHRENGPSDPDEIASLQTQLNSILCDLEC